MALVPAWLGRAGVVLALLVSALLVRRLDRDRDWGRVRRSRLLLGLPVGTLLSVGIVLSVYLFVQGGLDHWYNPVVVPFRSWSYFSPLGIVVSAFAHQSAGHLLGNLFSTLVLGSLAEYAWGHFPEERGTTSFGEPLANPFVRALVLFPAGVVGVGLLTGLFAAGPVVGFSGVVYAFAGFSLVRYPLGTVVGLTADNAVEVVYRALQEPVISRQAGSRFIEPWWASVSLQGHLLGMLIGVLLGAYLFRRRDENPSAMRLWMGALLFGIAANLWIVWWYRGNNSYVLYRVVGLWLVVGLGLLIASAVAASDRGFPDWLTLRRVAAGLLGLVALGLVGWLAADPPVDLPTVATPVGSVSIVAAGGLVLTLLLAVVALLGDRPLFGQASRRDVATLTLALALTLTASVAIPFGFATIDDPEPPGEVAFDVRDYTVTYAENVTNEMVNVFDLAAFGETTRVRTSGVIVISEKRHIWTTMASTSRLKSTGRYEVVLGGVGWRETVTALRRGWSMAGGPSAYYVFLRPPDGNWTLAHRSDRALASPRLSGYRVGISPGSQGFTVELVRNGSVVASGPLPRKGNATALRGIRLVRQKGRLVAAYNGTEIQVANQESYN